MSRFVALVVVALKEEWTSLNLLNEPQIEGSTFSGASANFRTIWEVLQFLISERRAFFNGDWKFINMVLGLLAPAAMHPCPTCIVLKPDYANTKARLRCDNDYACKLFSTDSRHTPLLRVDPQRIVPLPLHVFLGIGNRLFDDVYPRLLGSEVVKAATAKVKQSHTTIGGGRSAATFINSTVVS